MATPTHDAYLDNGTNTGLTVGINSISHIVCFVKVNIKKFTAIFSNGLNGVFFTVHEEDTRICVLKCHVPSTFEYHSHRHD